MCGQPWTGRAFEIPIRRDYIRFATPFTIVHGWGETNRGLIDKWGAIPDAELPFQPNNGCDRCGTDYHQSAGDEGRIRLAASWLVQASKAARLHASIANSIYTHHHTIGIVVADANVTSTIVDPGQTPQILNYGIADSFDRLDAETGFSVTSKTSTATDRRVAIHAIAATEDALEGSVVAQNADLPDTVSTATRFEWGNSPPAAEDPSAIPSGSIGPRKFYDFTQANASTAQVNAVTSVMLVEGKLTTTSSDTHPGDNPTIGPNETGLRQSDNAQLITSYASLGFDVVASEEAFLGPGQRAGYFTLAAGTTLYSHANSKQRGGAFVATLYDPATGDPVQIAHIGANVGDFGPVGIKGGGGGTQPNQQSMYDPAMAGDLLKSKFVDRSKAIGVDLESGAVTYESPATLTTGSGDFPYSLSASLIWRGGEFQDQDFGPINHAAPTTPVTTNWNNTLAISGSAIEAMGENDIRAAAGTVAAFMAMQDVYRSAVSPQREVTAVLAGSWWVRQVTGNVAAVNVGAGTRQFLKTFDGTWFAPGAGEYGTLSQVGQRVVYVQPKCTNKGYSYVLTRGWDYSGVSFAVTSAHGDTQNFSFWGTTFNDQSGQFCAFQHGFRMSSWTFPYGVTVNLVYQQLATGQLDDLVQVNNSLGRQINFVQSGLGGFNNGLTGADLRTVGMSGYPLGPFSTSLVETEPTGAQTTLNFALSTGVEWQLNNVLRADNATTPGIAYTYDTLGRVQLAQDATALQLGNRHPYAFYLAEGARADRVDPAGGDYSIINDIYHRPLGYIDEIGRSTAVTHDGRGRVTSYTYPEGNQEQLGYDDHNNPNSLIRVAKPGSSLANISVSAVWDPAWNKPTSVTDALGCQTILAYYSSNPGMSLLNTATRCAPGCHAIDTRLFVHLQRDGRSASGDRPEFTSIGHEEYLRSDDGKLAFDNGGSNRHRFVDQFWIRRRG